MFKVLQIKSGLLIMAFATILLCSSCDPVHDIKLENRSGGPMEVIFYPSLDERYTENHEVTKVKNDRFTMDRIVLENGEQLVIGTVIGRYTPNETDFELGYLEIQTVKGSLPLNGKQIILQAIQKVARRNWRIIIR